MKERRKLTKADINKIKSRTQEIIDDIDILLNDTATQESAEGEKGEAISNFQAQLDDALGYFED